MAKKSSVSKSTRSNSKGDDIKFIRLTNGEDIVAEVLDMSNGRIVVNNPLKVLYTPSVNTGFLSISLMQWVFTRISIQQKFDMDMQNVLIMTDADIKLKSHYKDSLQTFNREKEDYDDDTEFDTLDNEEGLEMLKNILDKIKGNKGSLH